MSTDLATLEHDGAISTLTLRRPDARNALSLDLLTALHQRVNELEGRNDALVLIITGEGKAFCAGMDLRAVLDVPGAPAQLLGSIAELTLALRALPMVTLAKVNGAAIGGGCGLMAVCDIAITHADAKLGYPEVDLGVCPAVVAPWLQLRVGAGEARRILLQGGLMSGTEAHRRGMVSDLVETRDQLDDAAAEVAARLSTGGPESIRATKRWLNAMDPERLAQQVREGAALSAQVVESDEARARLRERFGSG